MSTYPQLPDELVFGHPRFINNSLTLPVVSIYRFYSSHCFRPIIIEPVFWTDGYSIPRIFWSILAPFGQPMPPCVFHDFLYSKLGGKHYPHLTRKQIDLIFLECMELCKVPRWKRSLIYRAVRIGGWKAFRNA